MSIARPVIAFALLKQCSEVMRTDFLGGISILISPLVTDLAGQRFSSELLSKRVADTYGMSIDANVLEEFLPRFRDAGLVEIRNLTGNVTEAVFSQVEIPAADPADEVAFQGLLDEFVNFSEKRLKNIDLEITREKLVDGLLSRITSLDFLSIQIKPPRNEALDSANKVVGPTAKQNQELDREISEDARIDVLVASYISEVITPNSDRLDLISRVADGALGAELVFDLQAPKQIADLSKVVVILDTPLILSLLDLSSHQSREYVEKLVASITRVGAKLTVFRHSVEEAEGVLTAVKNGLLYGDAYGPTADRMRSSSYRAFFETMIGKIGSRLIEQKGFEILTPCATHFYQHFTSEDEEQLTARLHFSLLDKRIARERDALSVAETMRRRAGGHAPSHRLDACRFLFITSNSSLQRQARSYLLDKKLLASSEFPSVVTDRYLSGLLWLLFGGKSNTSLSTARLLANCANALKSRPDIVKRTKSFLSTLDPIKAQHFEALMTSERAAQFVTEITLGDAALVTRENAEKIYAQVEAIAAEKVAKEKDEFYAPQLSQLNAQVKTSEELIDGMRSELSQVRLDRDVNKERLSAVTQNLDALQESFEKQEALLKNQSTQMDLLQTNFATMEKERIKRETDQLQQKEQQEKNATKICNRKVTTLRIIGVAISVIAGLTTGYIDKFVVPSLPLVQQAAGNIVVIILQVLTATVTLGTVFEFLFGWIFMRFKKKIFFSYLIERSWNLSEIESAWKQHR